MRPTAFLQRFDDDDAAQRPGEPNALAREITRVDGRDAGVRTFSPSYARRGGAFASLQRGVGVVIKQLARALCVSPLLILARLIANSVAPASGGYFVAVFACIVVAFFVVLNIYIFVAFLGWGAKSHVALDIPTREGREAIASARPLMAMGETRDGERVRVRGTVRRIAANEGPLIRDTWSRSRRLTEMTPFAVVPASREHVIAVITFGSAKTAPVVIAPVLEMPLDASSPAADGSPNARVLEIAEGDIVEVSGTVARWIDDIDRFEADGEACSIVREAPPDGAAPYRDGDVESASRIAAELAGAPGMPIAIRTEAKK